MAGLAAGQDIGVIGANHIHVRGGDGLGCKSGVLERAAGHAVPDYIAQPNFKVNFPAWSTQRAENGDCLFSRAGNEVLYSDIPANSTDYAFAFVPDLPVEVSTPNFRISDPFWFGPPAYRIPVGGKYAIPGPVRDKPPDAVSGGNMPGNYYDERENFFEQIIHKRTRFRASYYSIRWMNMLRGVDPLTEEQNDPLHQPAPIVGVPAWYFGSFYLDQGQAQATNITQFDLIRMNNLVHGNVNIPNNSAARQTWTRGYGRPA